MLDCAVECVEAYVAEDVTFMSMEAAAPPATIPAATAAPPS